MRKVLLDLNPARSVVWIHEYLKFALEFDDYYGQNLDALYDQLTSVTEDTCLGVFCPPVEDTKLSQYLKRMKRVFRDAEEENPRLCVIFGDMEDNYEEE